MNILRLTASLLTLAFVTTAAAQTSVSTDVFGRYRINNFLGSAEVADFSWGPSTGTFGFAPTANDVWAQLLQFNAGAEAAAFGAAPAFSLQLAPDLDNGGRSYSIFVDVGSTDFSGFAAGANIVKNSGFGLSGIQIASGVTLSGSFTVSEGILDTFLAGVDFGATPYVYFTFRPDVAGAAGGTVDLSGSTLTAIPEPRVYAAIFGLAALAWVGYRRRFSRAAK